MSTLSFHVIGNPVAKGRPRVVRGGKFPRTYTPKKTREWEEVVAAEARQAAWEQVGLSDSAVVFDDDLLAVEIAFYLPIPKSWSKKKTWEANGAMQELGALHGRRPDLDNLVKSVLDAMDGIVFRDDAQIGKVTAEKRYRSALGGPCVYVRVESKGKRL